MAIPNPTPIRSDTAAPNSRRLAIDNLIRSELKVTDPTDPQQVAQGLLERYRNEGRAQAIEQEARGLPFLQAPSAPSCPLPGTAATGVDLQQALSDVDVDLRQLGASNVLKDIAPELDGWGDHIRSAIEGATASAPYAMDPRQRDQALSARRTLGEYALMSRVLGTLTPAEDPAFRSLAQSIDEVCAVILVTMGESLANVGFAGGRFLLQVPFGELQIRRDAALHALRNLSGSTQQAFTPDGWSRGLDSYRQVFNLLEDQGQGDLRVVMNETQLARAMDQLIHLAGSTSTDGLRALGATAWSQLNQFQRLVQLTLRRLPPSPPLSAFQESLQLFIDGFTPGGGTRLLRVARPPILFYGLYGGNDLEDADHRLLQLVTHRGAFAAELDCLAREPRTAAGIRLQVALDRTLFLIDRAIDLYCVGIADLGLPEARAAAYSFYIEALLPAIPGGAVAWPWNAIAMPDFVNELNTARAPYQELLADLQAFRQVLRPLPGPGDNIWSAAQRGNFGPAVAANAQWTHGLAGGPIGLADVLQDELFEQQQADINWAPIVEQMTDGCAGHANIFGAGAAGCLGLVVERAMSLCNPPVPPMELLQPAIPADVDSTLSHYVYGQP